jgi:hypothetical protein
LKSASRRTEIKGEIVCFGDIADPVWDRCQNHEHGGTTHRPQADGSRTSEADRSPIAMTVVRPRFSPGAKAAVGIGKH